jgi:hypothetical protein
VAGVPPASPQPIRLPLQFPSALSAQSVVRLHFPRNEPQNPAKYIGERPEMTSQEREAKEGQKKN